MNFDKIIQNWDLKNCKDLALQLFEHDDIDVIMGGGREWFVDRNDKRNLIQVIIYSFQEKFAHDN